LGLVLFDLKRHCQIVFDPHVGYTQHNSQTSDCVRRLCGRQLHPGFQAVPAQQCLYPTSANSLQGHAMARMHNGIRDVCGILCLLVLVCCTRFGFYNTKAVGDILRTKMTPQQGIQDQLISWYLRILNNTPPGQVMQTVFPRVPDLETCCTYSFATRGLCTRGPCRSSPHLPTCWQHRFIVFNRNATGQGRQRCNRAQNACN
jgi:hypothetical protein